MDAKTMNALGVADASDGASGHMNRASDMKRDSEMKRDSAMKPNAEMNRTGSAGSGWRRKYPHRQRGGGFSYGSGQ